jgi:hypothetical protein
MPLPSFHLVFALTVVATVDAGAPPPEKPAAKPPLLAPVSAERPGDPAADYELRRVKDGSGVLIYDAAGFIARVARDGSVTFRDKHLSLAFSLFQPRIRQPATIGVPSLESIVRGHGQRRDPPTPVSPEEQAALYGSRLPIPTVTPYRPDPREACQYPQPCFFNAPVLLVSVTGRFDLTDELMRLAGQDPYRYAKARFLAATRELRIRMAARAHADDLRESAAALPDHLQAIACDEGLSIAERRDIIEALRAELDTSTPEARATGTQIGRFLSDIDRLDGGSPCPVRRSPASD